MLVNSVKKKTEKNPVNYDYHLPHIIKKDSFGVETA